jgi:hypothetical protein
MSRFCSVLGILMVVALLCTSNARADSLYEGRYEIVGKLPQQQGAYAGSAQIKQTGETYIVAWRIDDVVYLGTGVRSGDVLSVVFMPLNVAARPGIASLRIENDRVTQGMWSVIGARDTVFETWTPAETKAETF